MYHVRVTAEAAPRNQEFWTLDNKIAIFETLEYAQAYVLFLESQETETDKADPYYNRFGPIIEIMKITERLESVDWNDVDDNEPWEVLE